MANQTRACPIWKTSREEIMPMSAPMRTTRRRLDTWSFLRVLTTGAASSSSVSHLTRPVNNNDGDVEECADDQSSDDAAREVALRVGTFFGCGGDGVKTDVRKKDDGTTGENAGPAIGCERVPIGRVDEFRGEGDEG